MLRCAKAQPLVPDGCRKRMEYHYMSSLCARTYLRRVYKFSELLDFFLTPNEVVFFKSL
jgi:hypothetical protein